MSFDEHMKDALQAREDEALKDWSSYHNKMQLNKALIVLLHGFELFGLGIIFQQTSNYLLCIGVPALIGINSLIMKNIDEKSTKYWNENWMQPFRTIHDNPSEMIIDGAYEDTTLKLRDRNN